MFYKFYEGPQRPLTESELSYMKEHGVFMRPVVQIIRAIELAHGIVPPEKKEEA